MAPSAAPPSTQRPHADGSSSSRRRQSAARQQQQHQHDDDDDRIGPYLIGEEIGRGSFATVFKGERYDNRAEVAIKSVIRSKLTIKLLENLESEISILKEITHRNVVELKDCLKTETHIYLIMAFCSAGDLSVYIRKRGEVVALSASNQGLLPAQSRSLKDSELHRVLYPHPKEGGLNETIMRCFLIDALRFLRSKNVIHRDIKPQNLLLKPADAEDLAMGHPPGIPVLKVADFGFARWLPQQSLAETLCGSPLYMAPEILRYEKYDAKADLWSVGAVLYEMCVGRPPFRAQNHVDLLRKIERGEDKIKFPDEQRVEEGSNKTPTQVAPDLKALIRRLLKRNPPERMSFEDFFREAASVGTSGTASGLTTYSTDPSARRGVVPEVPSANLAAQSSTVAQSAVPVPPATSPSPPSARNPAYADTEPPPFARRPSSATPPLRPSTPGTMGSGQHKRVPSSFVAKYVVGGPSQANSGATTAVGDDNSKPSPTMTKVQEASPVFVPSAIQRSSAKNEASSTNASMTDSNDSIVGRDFVVVDKRTVEINALADELATQPKREGTVARRPSRGFLSRPLSSLGNNISPSPPSPVAPYPPTAPPSTDHIATAYPNAATPFAVPQQRPGPTPHPYSLSSSPRPLSFLSSSPRSLSHPIERFPGSPLALVGSPTAAIAKALNMASLKLFGSPTDGILVRRSSARKPLHRTAQISDPDEERILGVLEDIAQKALVLFDFADSKILQLLPPTPQTSSSTSLGTPSYFSHVAAREQQTAASNSAMNPFSAIPTPTSLPMRRTSSSSSSEPRPMGLASSAKADVVAAEALMLYLKSLAFLHKGIERARLYWTVRSPDQAPSSDFNDGELDADPRFCPNDRCLLRIPTVIFTAVQWFRQRFNECFDKADFAKSRCQDEIPESATYAEKLVYDRALEISRAAAVHELKGESPTDCETAYETALWMLYAILDETMSGSAQSAVEDEDRAVVNKFVASITARLQALRRKIG
ncbi:BQ5605_C010g05977 [Microbotryum silenes-dioicae]|uniref:non-specific serine/threonine protein kinase n=1 Tax=Microbotryum silenes-dioicae TaxID=796604 RepID=A0A2X0LUM0_9BASI|nr:BQ5605_C010g05977 [Microbotryum silenes-dioicae]